MVDARDLIPVEFKKPYDWDIMAHLPIEKICNVIICPYHLHSRVEALEKLGAHFKLKTDYAIEASAYIPDGQIWVIDSEGRLNTVFVQIDETEEHA